jgi:hypothetical protein
MNPEPQKIEPDWKWGTAEGSRELDRLLDRQLTFMEKLEWLEAAETLSLHWCRAGSVRAADVPPSTEQIHEAAPPCAVEAALSSARGPCRL